ncbi:hypothetical protein Zm00014a_039332, partial [Zea mays]
GQLCYCPYFRITIGISVF